MVSSHNKTKLYRVTIKLLSPTILTKKYRRNIYEAISGQIYLPSRAIRGALLEAFAREISVRYGIIRKKCFSPESEEELCKKLVEEIEDPFLRIQPAYPIYKNIKAEPAGPFVFRRKMLLERESEISSHSGNSSRELFSCIKLSELLGAISLEELIKKIPSVKEGYPKTLLGKLIIVNNSKIEEVDIPIMRHESTAINKIYYKAEEGMLFSYETLPAGLQFRTIIFDGLGFLAYFFEKLELGNEIEVFIGRGRTRGFGRAIMRFNELHIEEFVEKRAKELEKIGIRSTCALKALSPIIRITDGLHSRPYLEKIEYPPNDIKSVCPDIPEATLNLRKLGAEDKELWMIFGDLIKLKGWSTSYRGSGPIPSYYAGMPGNLYVYEISSPDPLKALSFMEITGADEFSAVGYNWFKVVDKEEVI